MTDLESHIIESGRDGRASGASDADVRAVVEAAMACDRIVFHIHGGLVNRAAGKQIAANLLPVYTAAGAYPVFFVWHSGALEVVSANLKEILTEELFNRVLRVVLKWTVGKLRSTQGGGGRSASTAIPDRAEMGAEMGGRNAGKEAFFGEAPRPDADEELELSRDEQLAFVQDVELDEGLRTSVLAAIAGRNLLYTDEGGRAATPMVKPRKSLIDDDVLLEIAKGRDEGSREPLLSIVALGRKALRVLTAVLARYRFQIDHGLYPTVLEEVLRQMYFTALGGTVWNAMKKETLDTFQRRDRDQGVGRITLDALARSSIEDALPRITLVGHSTGAVFINNLLADITRDVTQETRTWGKPVTTQVAFLAPACTTKAFADMLDASSQLIGRFRMFTMTDVAEQADRLLGALYPRSLLYLVAGALERVGGGSHHAPVLGQLRYFGPEQSLHRLLESNTATTARLRDVRRYLAGPGRVAVSPSADDAPDGMRAGCSHHGDFDDDPLVRDSLAHLIRTW